MGNENGNAEPPEFHSKVPAPLLALCNDSPEGQIRRYLLECASVQEQQTAWLVRVNADEAKSLRSLSTRVAKTEEEVRQVLDWKATLTGKNAILGAVLFIVASAMAGAACKAAIDAMTGK